MSIEANTIAVEAGINEDNWDKTKNAEANKSCPNNDPFVYIPSTINGMTGLKTKWWTNYWWGMNEFKRGTYVWGDGMFDSNFDPKKFYEQTPQGIKLKAFFDKNWVNPDNGQVNPTWITSELVSGGLDTQNDYFYGKYGHYAVILEAKDLGDLDPQVCLGVFTYQYGKAPNPDDGRKCENLQREIDLLETISNAQQQNRGNAQFAVQPANGEPHPEGTSLLRFAIPKGTPVVTAYMYWGDPMGLETTKVKLYAGDHSISDITHNIALKPIQGAEWELTHDKSGNGAEWYKNVPKCKNQRVHINLYVPGGNHNQKADRNKLTEVLVKRFEYTAK